MKLGRPRASCISQVILAAPDVDADNFTNLAQAIKGFAKGVTLYASSNDRALLRVAQLLGQLSRGRRADAAARWCCPASTPST